MPPGPSLSFGNIFCSAVVLDRMLIKSRPYLIDLGSANGTHLNGEKLKKARYYELRHQDVITLGHSTREYVLVQEDME